MKIFLAFTLGVVFVMVGLFGAYIPSAKAVNFNVPADYLTIQAAIDAANSGDEIIVAKGTYKENINFKGKAITVRSAAPDDPGIVEDTIIDGNGLGSVVTFNNGEDLNAVLSGFTIQNGLIGVSCRSSSPIISNCIISNNNNIGILIPTGYFWHGGGVYCNSSSPSIIYCTISDNYANVSGGGVDCVGASSPGINHCTINDNFAAYGGGVCSYNNSSSPSISHCIISDNSAKYGGGVCCYNRYSLTSSPIIDNCTISDNSAIKEGGGVYCESSSPGISNCTITGNSAAEAGGGVYCYDSSSPYITNSIIWNNSSGIFALDFSLPKLCYCDIQGGYSGLGNIDVDPLFVDPINGDYRLQTGSLCINAGHPRIYDLDASPSDMGRFGGEGGCDPNSLSITVSQNESTNFLSIQDAIDYALTGDTISVSPGVYTENLVIVGKDILLVSSSGKDSTTIDGSEAGTVIFLSRIGPSALIEGFSIQNGSAFGGGGIRCYSSSSHISNCAISGNFATYGGGVWCSSSSPSISRCTINGNSANSGGGVWCWHTSSPDISNCDISDNSAVCFGGGMGCMSTPNISNSTISGNSANVGGGVWCWDRSSSLIISNCTISGNSAICSGGGLWCGQTASPYLINSILWGNGSEVYAQESGVFGMPELGANPQIRYCNIQGGYTGVGNIDAEPLFVDAENRDFHLLPGSPCIDAGANNEALLDMEIPSTDKD